MLFKEEGASERIRERGRGGGEISSHAAKRRGQVNLQERVRDGGEGEGEREKRRSRATELSFLF